MVSRSVRRMRKLKAELAAAKPQVQQRPAPAKRPVPAARAMAPGQAEARMKKTEYYGSQKAGVLCLPISPGASGLPLLDKWGKLYELYTIHSLQLRVVPIVGTTVGGNYVATFTYEINDKPVDYKSATIPDPKIANPVWKGGVVNATRNRLNKQQRMLCSTTVGEDTLAAYAVVAVQDPAVNKASVEVWITYDITFRGMNVSEKQVLSKTPVYIFNGSKWVDSDGSEITDLPQPEEQVEVTLEVDAKDTAWPTIKQYIDSLFGPDWVQVVQQGTVRWLTTTVNAYLATRLRAIAADHAVLRVAPYPFHVALADALQSRQGQDRKTGEANNRIVCDRCSAGSDYSIITDPDQID